jgi:hypothetical protein
VSENARGLQAALKRPAMQNNRAEFFLATGINLGD